MIRKSMPNIRRGELNQANIRRAEMATSIIKDRWGASPLGGRALGTNEIENAGIIYDTYKSQLLSYENDIVNIWDNSLTAQDAANKFEAILKKVSGGNHQTYGDGWWEMILVFLYCLWRLLR